MQKQSAVNETRFSCWKSSQVQSEINGVAYCFLAVIFLSSGPAFCCRGCSEHGSETGTLGDVRLFHKLFYSLQCCIFQGLAWLGLGKLQGRCVVFLLLSGKKKSFLLFGSVSEVLRQMVKVYERSGCGPQQRKVAFSVLALAKRLI